MLKYVPPEELEKLTARFYEESVATLRDHRERCAAKNPDEIEWIRHKSAQIAEAERLAIARATQLDEMRQFRIDVYAGSTELPPRPKAAAFTLDATRLVRAAPYRPLQARRHTVSAFKDWVNSLYNQRARTLAYWRWRMRQGKQVEADLAQRDLARRRERYRGDVVFDDRWEPVYRDIDPTSKAWSPSLPIPALSIHGAPMWGKPDIVFRHLRTRELVIIERKASDAAIPTDGWPDLRAQLWCYAQIDHEAWRAAPLIRVVAEVWQPDLQTGRHALRVYDGGLLRWVKGDAKFEADNAALFETYKRRIEQENVALASGQHDDDGKGDAQDKAANVL